MPEAQVAPQYFNTQLPYVVSEDTTQGNDSVYADYLYDSINVKKPDSTFVFELKEIQPYTETDSTKTQVVLKPSVFFPEKSTPVIIKQEIRNEVSDNWLTGFFLLSLLLLAWLRYEGEKRIAQIFKAVFARHNVNQLLRDGDIISERITPALMFVYLISITTLIFSYYNPLKTAIFGQSAPFLWYLLIMASLLVLWVLKLIAISISGKVFRTRTESDEYLVTNLIHNITAGLVAFPFVFAGYYAENQISIYIATGIFIMGMLLRFVRSIFVGLSAQTFPVVYLFLYLCTLEILPLLILYKLISI